MAIVQDKVNEYNEAHDGLHHINFGKGSAVLDPVMLGPACNKILKLYGECVSKDADGRYALVADANWPMKGINDDNEDLFALAWNMNREFELLAKVAITEAELTELFVVSLETALRMKAICINDRYALYEHHHLHLAFQIEYHQTQSARGLSEEPSETNHIPLKRRALHTNRGGGRKFLPKNASPAERRLTGDMMTVYQICTQNLAHFRRQCDPASDWAAEYKALTGQEAFTLYMDQPRGEGMYKTPVEATPDYCVTRQEVIERLWVGQKRLQASSPLQDKSLPKRVASEAGPGKSAASAAGPVRPGSGFRRGALKFGSPVGALSHE